MYSDHTDRNDLCRLADDGCPHVSPGDTGVTDVSEVWGVLGKDDRSGG
jgi:hypothetical protein